MPGTQGDLLLTLAWWHNALVERGKKDQYGERRQKWLKALSFSGSMNQFTRGAAAQKPYPCQKAEHQHDSHGHQIAIMLTRDYRFFVVDVDDPSQYEGTRTSRIITADHAISSRGMGYHVLVHVPDELLSSWPHQTPIPGADIKSSGFVPLPGCIHFSGERYEPAHDDDDPVEATAELLEAIRSDQAFSRPGGAGASDARGQQGELLRMLRTQVMEHGWRETDEREAWRWYLPQALGMPSLDEDPWDEDGAAEAFRRHWDWIEKRIIPNLPSPEQEAWFRNAIHRGNQNPAGISANGSGTLVAAAAAAVLSTDHGGGSDGNGGNNGDGSSDDGNLLPDGYRIPLDYDISDRGIFFIHRPARGETWQECIAHRPVIITGIADTVSGTETWYELTWLDGELGRNSIIASVDDIADARKLPRLFSELVVTSHTSGKLSKFFGELATENTSWLASRKKRIATQLGWQGSSLTDFELGPGRPYEFSDQKNTGGWLQGHRAGGDLESWREGVRACRSQIIPMMALAASFSAPLLRLLDQSPFVFDISYSTSTGKTITLWLAASVWGDPSELVGSWHNTLVANEHYLSCLRGLPYFQGESQLAKPESVSSLVYSLTEGHSKGRSRQDGQGLIGHVNYESVLISCGENSLASFSSQGGIMPRLVTAESMPMASAEMASRVKRISGENFGHAGETFISSVLQHDPSSLKTRYQVIRSSLRASAISIVSGRRADSVAVMALAADLAGEAGLLPHLPGEMWEFLISGGGAVEDDADDRSAGALNLLATEVAFNSRSFWRRDLADSAFQVAPADGWHGRLEPGEYVAVRPDWLKTFLSARGYDYDRIVKTWREKGWIDSRPGALTKSVRVEGRVALAVKIICQDFIAQLDTVLDISQQGVLRFVVMT